MYKYLESKLTCARVREFNSKPPPELKIPDPPNTTTKTKKTTDKQPKTYYRSIMTVEKAGKELNNCVLPCPIKIKSLNPLFAG